MAVDTEGEGDGGGRSYFARWLAARNLDAWRGSWDKGFG